MTTKNVKRCPICGKGPKVHVGGYQDQLEHWCSEQRGHYLDSGWQESMIQRWNIHCEYIEKKDKGEIA